MKIALLTLVLIVVSLIAFDVLFVVFVGTTVPEPKVTSEPMSFGDKGTTLKFAVLGDSLTVAQGGDYQKGIAVSTAKHLASNHMVTMINAGVSGARTNDVLREQLPKVLDFKPDVVLLTVSANDMTHMSSLESVDKDFRDVVDRLKAANPTVKIVITGAPAMGSVPRFPWPANTILGRRAAAMNRRFDRITKDKGLYFAHVADRTGRQFAEDDSFSAQDKFHPSDKGYELWNEVIGEQIELIK